MRRPSVTNILAVLAALYVGATCAGCIYTPAPSAPVGHGLTCVVLAAFPGEDSLTVGIYAPPCGENADSVFYWRLPLPRDCAWRATVETPRGSAKVQSACTPTLFSFPRG